MPRPKKRGASLGVKPKGYWKVWKKQKVDNDNTNNETSQKIVSFTTNNVVEFEPNVEINNSSNNVNSSTDNLSVSAASDDFNIVPT